MIGHVSRLVAIWAYATAGVALALALVLMEVKENG